MIHDVIIEPRKVISNEKGDVLHMLRKDDLFFKELIIHFTFEYKKVY